MTQEQIMELLLTDKAILIYEIAALLIITIVIIVVKRKKKKLASEASHLDEQVKMKQLDGSIRNNTR